MNKPLKTDKLCGKKIIVTEFTGLDGKKVTAYTAEDDSFSFKATRSGVTFSGALELQDEDQLQDFAALLSDVWLARRRAVPKLSKTVSGH